MRLKLYLHSSKEYALDRAIQVGLVGAALQNAMYLGYEHEMEYEVDETTGHGVLIAVDGKTLANV